MADFTAKDVQSAAPGHRRRHDRRQEGPRGERRRHRRGRQVAAREGPGQAGQARRPRDRRGRGGRRPTPTASPPSSSCDARPTSWPSPTQFVALVDELAELVAAKGEDAAAERAADAIDDLKITLKENISVGQVVRFEAGDGQRRSTPTCTCRTAGASTPSWSSWRAAPTSWPTTSPSTSPSPSPPYLTPRRRPRGRGRRRARAPLENDHPQRGQARGGPARRSSRAG